LAALSRLHRFGGDQPLAAELAREALGEAGPDDRVRAEAAQALAATLFYLREDLEEGVVLAGIAAEHAARAKDEVLEIESRCVKGLLECLVGDHQAAATLRAVAEQHTPPTYARVLSTPAFNQGVLALWTEHSDATQLLLDSREATLERGDEGSAPMVFAQVALCDYLAGRWAQAARVADDAYDLALQTGQRPMQGYSLATRALVRAAMGLEEDARTDAELALALAGSRGMAASRIHAVWALGLLELSLDRPDETERLAAPERRRLLAAGVGEPGTVRFVPDEIEALVALGRADEAEALIGWLERQARRLDRPFALAATERCRGLLALSKGETDAALEAFHRALAEHARVANPFERARTLLVLGATQRRSMMKRVARGTIGEALSVFEDLGAVLWAAKARTELDRIGGRAAASGELTPTETRVALLAAEGKTNRQIAAEMYVTQKTVEFHLRNAYAKLSVRSRTQLARALHSGKA
jgi:DNA-binding CsgD family transcriptional regulator